MSGKAGRELIRLSKRRKAEKQDSVYNPSGRCVGSCSVMDNFIQIS